MKKKKLLFVINTISAAGAEMSFLELLRRIDGARFEVYLYVLMAQGELRCRLPTHVRLLNRSFSDRSVLSKEGKRHMVRRVLACACRRGTLFFQMPYLISNFLYMMKQRRVLPDKLLWRLLAQGADRFEEEFDLAVAYLEGGSAYYVADYVKAKRKAAFLHIDYARAGYTRALDRSCYVRFDHIFAVSCEAQRSFLAVYPEKAGHISLFHNPMDRGAIREKSREPISQERWNAFDGKRLLTVGRLNPQKAYEVAIETMRELKASGVHARWYVLGDGAERERLAALIASCGLEEDFVLLGAVDNPYPYYAGCDLYVHATRYEGRSVAIQEAQALGAAVLASDCSGNREQIRDGCDGVLVELVPARIAEEIRRLLGDGALREALGSRGKEKPSVYPEDIERLLSLAGEGAAACAADRKG